MPDAPSNVELQRAILQYLASSSPSETGDGALHVKVSELEPVTWPPDSEAFRGGLFLSVRFLGADRTRLDQAFAQVRKGFKHDELLPGWRVEVVAEEVYSHRDEEVGAVLLTLPVVLTAEPA